MTHPADIRRLRSADVLELRRVRLEGLRDEPTAFGSSFEHESRQPEAFWSGWIERNPPFGAFDSTTLVGLASLTRETAANTMHRGTLGAMYVTPAWRGTGAAAALVEAALAHARSIGIEQVHLTVTASNARGVRFYERLGFTSYGRRPRGSKYDGEYHDLLLMVRLLP